MCEENAHKCSLGIGKEEKEEIGKCWGLVCNSVNKYITKNCNPHNASYASLPHPPNKSEYQNVYDIQYAE